MSAVTEDSKGASYFKVRGASPVLPNICISYMYRDASNYKRYEEVVFANPRRLAVEQIWADVRVALEEVIRFFGEPMFRPERLGLPTVFLYSLSCYSKNDDDHDWHELCSIEGTKDPVMKNAAHTIDEFLDALRKTHGHRLG